MNDLEKKCKYKEVCTKDFCFYQTLTNCKLYQHYVMMERLGKIRSSEGSDYLYFVEGEEIENE